KGLIHAMVKKSPWIRFLPALGILLAALLAAAALALWWDTATPTSPAMAEAGRLTATAQAARADMRGALGGEPAALQALESHRAQLERSRGAVRAASDAPPAVR